MKWNWKKTNSKLSRDAKTAPDRRRFSFANIHLTAAIKDVELETGIRREVFRDIAQPFR